MNPRCPNCGKAMKEDTIHQNEAYKWYCPECNEWYSELEIELWPYEEAE